MSIFNRKVQGPSPTDYCIGYVPELSRQDLSRQLIEIQIWLIPLDYEYFG